MKNYKKLLLEQLKAQRDYIEIYSRTKNETDLRIISQLEKTINCKDILTKNEFDNYDEEMVKIDARISKKTISLKKQFK